MGAKLDRRNDKASDEKQRRTSQLLSPTCRVYLWRRRSGLGNTWSACHSRQCFCLLVYNNVYNLIDLF